MKCALKIITITLLLIPSLAMAAYSGTISRNGTSNLEIDVETFQVTQAGTVTLEATSADFDVMFWLDGPDSDAPVFTSVYDNIGGSSAYMQLDLDVGIYSVYIGSALPGFSLAEAQQGYVAGINSDFWHNSFGTEGLWNLEVATPVPVPAALPLFASSLLGLNLLRRKRKA